MTLTFVHQMLDRFPALYLIIDQEQQQLVHVSEAAASLLGYEPGELLGKNLSDTVMPEDYYRTLAAIADLTQGGYQPGFTNSMRHKNGRGVPISWYGTYDPQRNLIYSIGRMAALFELPAHQGAAVADLNFSDHGEMVVDAAWRITHVNQTAAALIRQNGREMLHQNLWDCFPQARGTICEQQYNRAQTQQVPVRFEAFCPSLHQQWFEVTAFPFGQGLCIFFRNIDSEKQAQEELWKLSLIARETTNVVVLTDAAGLITWVNDAFCRTSGYRFDEAVGQQLSRFRSGIETDMAAILAMEDAMLQGESFQLEMLHYNKAGEKMWASVHGQPIKDHHNKVQQFFSIETDISERKKFEEQLKLEQQQRQRKITRATIDAQERERSLVSQELHDNVNQVLTTVKLYTELCLSGIDQQEELLRKSVQLLQDSINEIRALSKRLSAPTLGKLRLRDSIRELAESIEATNRLLVELELEQLEYFQVPQDLHLAIYRILQEHFTNILKHASATLVQVSFELVDEELVLKVRDNGLGFNTQELRNGIGIANMVSRAESLKGKLTINSAPGLGCVLLVRFPVDHSAG